jgi:hypothetical protein
MFQLLGIQGLVVVVAVAEGAHMDMVVAVV